MGSSAVLRLAPRCWNSCECTRASRYGALAASEAAGESSPRGLAARSCAGMAIARGRVAAIFAA
eukprot:1135461-Alexandrium_andersonii.AAC.1